MRSLVAVPAAAVLLAGMSAATVVATAEPASAAPASVSAASALPTCPGVRVMRHALYTREMLKAAYIHVFYDARTRTVCAFLNSTYATWGTRKHMLIRVKICSSPSKRHGQCIGQLQSDYRAGWYTGRTSTVRLHVPRGCIMATGRIYWGKHYGLTHTTSTFCVGGVLT
ncbi:hypothetical protein TBS_34590 [Thermobispora bispora]|uniref:Secreted protein n=1 Tax=Thermobispora bispora (strain ATCC 19993 / DSM 43833 / CBS 139.67 / JCM 10125 / KCTC 9307 / NBRC 14880 / R51) TaxID=469371 RepID=D6Y605_THEBD|nr:hypothetical protein [Thermobispora bispora]ADG89421.1 hypothetical protein Tbis_2721 [Thermobispora bispora DSM 43833]QSI49068.1 hypothetical protein CYL17_15395 [Thermobispora bispora]